MYIISCKYNYIYTDYDLLKYTHRLNKYIKIKTNYEIYLLCYELI